MGDTMSDWTPEDLAQLRRDWAQRAMQDRRYEVLWGWQTVKPECVLRATEADADVSWLPAWVVRLTDWLGLTRMA